MNLQQFLNILWSRKWFAILSFLLTVTTTVVVSLLLPKEYDATTSLVINHRSTDPVTGLNTSQLDPGYMATQADVIASHNVALKVVDKLGMAQNLTLKEDYKRSEAQSDIRDWVADIVLKNLDVLPSKESSVMQVSYSSVDPQFSAVVANAFAEAYIQTTVELRTQPAKQNAVWFDEQMALFREQLEKAQNTLSVYQQEHGIVVIDERLDLENSRLTDLAHQVAESQAKTYELQSRMHQFKEGLSHGQATESMEEVLSNSLVQGLKSDLARAEGKFADTSVRYSKKHPKYLEAQAEVTNLRNKIRHEISVVLSAIKSNNESSKQRDQSLVSALAEQKTRVLELKQQRDQVAVLNREVENAQRAYDNAMQRSVQTRMEGDSSQTNIAILNPAIPPTKPAKPKVMLNILLSIFLGSMLGVGIALLAELVDRRLRSPLDIIEILELPVLGVMVAPRKMGRWQQMTKGKQLPNQAEQGV
jgi:succinoglycan biosynthesis transport protein ExoP